MTQFYANNFKVELVLKDSYTTSLAFSIPVDEQSSYYTIYASFCGPE